MRTWMIVPLLLGTGALLLSACGPIHSITLGHPGQRQVHHGHHDGHGPPPHAPAHGHRRKWAHQRQHHDDQQRHHANGVEMVFDGALGVYVLVDMPNHYFWDGWYLRIEDGDWYASAELHGGHWEPRLGSKLPPGLAKKHHGRSQKRKHHRGRSRGHPDSRGGPAQPGW